MEAGAIVGIVIGCILFVVIVGYLVYVYWWKPYSMKKQEMTEEKYQSRHRRSRKMLDMYNIDKLYGDGDDIEMDGLQEKPMMDQSTNMEEPMMDEPRMNSYEQLP